MVAASRLMVAGIRLPLICRSRPRRCGGMPTDRSLANDTPGGSAASARERAARADQRVYSVRLDAPFDKTLPEKANARFVRCSANTKIVIPRRKSGSSTVRWWSAWSLTGLFATTYVPAGNTLQSARARARRASGQARDKVVDVSGRAVRSIPTPYQLVR